MDTPSILVADTNGVLAKDIYKTDIDRPVISAWLSDKRSEERTLSIALNNVRVDSLPAMGKCTYKTFLAYNGTLGLSKKVFTTVVAEDAGVLDMGNLPVLTYSPNNLSVPTKDMLSDVVIDIKMYNGTVDVLRYSEGELNNGEKTYNVKSIRSFPTTIYSMPNVEGNRVFMDGWYSYTTVIFRDIADGGTVTKGNFYARSGFIFKASHDGTLFKDASSGKHIVMRPGDASLSAGAVQSTDEDYEQILFSLNETTGASAMANNVYVHSQLLVTDQIRDAITAEAIEAAFAAPVDYVDFQAWQKLTLKRMSASVMFLNGLYENAQIILESARSICSVPKYNSNCPNC